MDELRIYWMVFSSSLQQKLEYKTDFILSVVTSAMLQLSRLAFLAVVVHQTQELGGWQAHEIMLLFGLTAMSLGLSELFFNAIWMVPYYIVMGDLDRLIIYPVNSLRFLLISGPVLHSFGNFTTGAALAAYSLHQAQAPWTSWALVPLWVASGCVLYTSTLIIAASFSFKFIGPYSHNLFFSHQLLDSSRWPLTIYPKLLYDTLLFLAPFGACIFLPAGWVLGKFQNLLFAVTAPLAAFLFGWVAQWCWDRGLKLYESTGS